MNKFLNISIAGLLLSTGCGQQNSQTKKPDKEVNEKKTPNIVLILCDDMGFSDLGCYGSNVQTPNLDNLAEKGLRFNQFHNTAKSFPSRACLLTGVYAQDCGMDKHHDTIRNAVTIAEVLKTAGYRTLAVGKHHGKENLYHRGFDRYFGLRDGCCNYWNPGEQREGEPIPAHKTWAKPRTWCIDSLTLEPYTPKEKDFYTTDYFTNYALDYLDEYKDEDKPFFLYMAYTAPHDPLHAWPEDQQKYLGKFMDGYEAERQRRYKKQQEMGLIDETFPLSAPTHQDWEELSEDQKLTEDSIMATHAAMIDRMDQNIGRVIKKIEDMGELDNTIILFMSDNGCQATDNSKTKQYNESSQDYPIGSIGRWISLSTNWANVGCTPFRYYKTYSHEGGTCTPLIVYWPAKIKETNRIVDFPSHFIDIMPTILEITGADYPQTYNNKKITPVKGISLLPIFNNQTLTRDVPLYFQWHKGKAIRDGKWKLVSDQNGPWELYDMSIDKTETNDLSDDIVTTRRLENMYNYWYSQYEEE